MDPIKILVVEDEGISAAYLQNFLNGLGYQTLIPQSSAEAAWEIAQAFIPDLVLMDIFLDGEIDGIQCAYRIREELDIPVIMLTANSDIEIMELSKASVPYGYIVKPFQENNLRAAIEMALNLHDIERQLRDSETRYRAIIEQSTEAIFSFDPPTLRILEVNSSFCRLLGYQPEEVTQLTLYGIIADRPEDFDLYIKKILESNDLDLLESQCWNRDKEIIQVEVNASLIHYKSRKLISMMLRDISERKRMEIELLQARVQLESQLVAQERTRLARDLHDSLTQALFSLTLFTETARQRAVMNDMQGVKEQLEQICEISSQSLKDLRLMVFELHPLFLEDGGLIRNLRQRLEAVEQRSGIRVRFLATPPDDQLPLACQKALYWIAQEALNNTLKHARASSVHILYLRENSNTIKFEIADDGIGFDPEDRTHPHGLGLRNMRERALDLHGSLQIVSSPRQGTKIIVSIPLNNEDLSC